MRVLLLDWEYKYSEGEGCAIHGVQAIGEAEPESEDWELSFL